MVRCRNRELQRVCPWGGISAGGDLAETQEFGEESRAQHPWSSLSAAAKDAHPSPGLQRDPGQPQALPALPSPKPHCWSLISPQGWRQHRHAVKWWSWRLPGVFTLFSKSIKWVELFQRISPHKEPGNSLEVKAGSLLSALCCGWAPAPGWCLLHSSDTTKWGKLQKALAIYSV